MSKLFLMSGMPVLLCAARQTLHFPVLDPAVNRPEKKHASGMNRSMYGALVLWIRNPCP